MGALVLGAVIVVATLFAILCAARTSDAPLRGRGHPGRWLLIVVALVYLNQVLFTVYVDRVHHGDAGFISRYVPPGWFDLADLGSFPQWFPAPDLLSWSLFRVSSFLELPFGLFAYLTVCRWLAPAVYRRAVRLIWPASIAYTVTFGLIEWTLHNPYTTVEDLVIRAVSGIVVPLLVSRFAGEGQGEGQSHGRSLPELAVFIVSVGALGYLVLAVYDSALLYNLGHVPEDAPGAAVAVVVLVLARLLARRLPAPQAGPGMTALIGSLQWFFVVFFVPALAIRYGLIFGQPLLGAVAGVLVVVRAVQLGVGTAVSRALVVSLATAVVVGVAAACVGYLTAGGYPEARVLIAAGVFLVAVIAVCALADHRLAERPTLGRSA